MLVAQAQEYVPGTPGAPWSMEEILVVKAKLYSIFSVGGGLDAMNRGKGDDYVKKGHTIPNAAKLLRLGFHDCLKYTDGTGGCDGCLNWEGMDYQFVGDGPRYHYENVGPTNNNGLGDTVKLLEQLYTNRNFPKVTILTSKIISPK